MTIICIEDDELFTWLLEQTFFLEIKVIMLNELEYSLVHHDDKQLLDKIASYKTG